IQPSRHSVFRFAPSPNGFLHLGHAYSALLNSDMAQRSGGRFLLRLEDIDVGRCKREFSSAILDDLAWLGITWEIPVRVQSAHFSEYGSILEQLNARELLYPCFCTRNSIAKAIGGRKDWP